jgi:hypothetical protein
MKRIMRVTALAIFVGSTALLGAAQGGGAAGQSPTRQGAERTTTQAKAREQQPAVSAQTTPNCSGRPGARCAKKGGAKKLRTIF